MTCRPLGVVALAALLSGCVTSAPPSNRVSESAVTAADETGSRAGEFDGLTSVGVPGAKDGNALVSATWSPSPAVDRPDMAALIGTDEARLTRLLGEPRLRRREVPAEVWQYAGKSCVLHVFFYRAGSGGYRVVHVEASRRSQPAGAGDCLGELIDERQAAQES